MGIQKPVQCHLWQKEEIAAGDLAANNFAVMKTYLDESHLIRRLLQCKDCRQLYFYEFYEEIDWEGGNDPQVRIWIPVAGPEEAESLSQLQPIELRQCSPRLQSDWPQNAGAPRLRWVGKA